MKLKIPKVKQKKEFKSVNPRSLVIKLKKGYILSKRKEKAEETKKVYVPEKLVIPSYPYGYPPGRGGPEVETLKGVEVKVEGIEIPVKFKTVGKAIKFEEERESMRFIDMRYPLIPHSPKKGETVFAYAHIKWHKKEGGVVYELIEPSISEKDKETIEKIKRDLEEKLDIDFTKLGTIQAKNILREEIEKAFSLMKDLSESKKRTLLYYIEKDIIGLGKIEPFINDPNIEDISCDGIKIPIYVYHRDPRFASLKTNIMFNDKDELDSFVMKIAQKCNKTISIAEPLMDAALPDGSRVQATLGTDIARKGSNFTIRKFTEKPLTPTHMLKFGTLNSTQLAYLWLAIDNGQSILVSGGTATGKTSLLNALSLFIRPNMKVVSIEDTAELRLPLPHWIPHVARTPLSIKGGVGEVTLFDLLKTSLRQRPDYIIVGEVRGREAFVLFQQMATGHPSLATIHAASIPQLIDRLITPPISLPPTLLENIDIIVFLTLARLKSSYVRRSENILEVIGIKDERPVTNKVFEWKPVVDTFESAEKSVILRNIAKRLGLTEESMQDELIRRKKIMEWMLEREIFDYREVARVINTYYSDPEKLMDIITEV